MEYFPPLCFFWELCHKRFDFCHTILVRRSRNSSQFPCFGKPAFSIMWAHEGKDGTKAMGRLLLQLGGGGIALCLTLLIMMNTQPTAATMVTQLQRPSPTEAATETGGITFPYEIPGTALVAESLAPYDGDFVEDGMGRQVCNVASLVLRNTGPAIAWLQVMLETDDGLLTFVANTVPAGGTVMVLEKDAGKYPVGKLAACRGQVIVDEDVWLDETQLQFETVDMGTVAMTNLTDKPMGKLRIYYKTYHADVDIYFGGVTYCTSVERVEPGETVLIEPSHYAQGYSQIVRVRID